MKTQQQLELKVIVREPVLLFSVDWPSIYHELGAMATTGHWHRTTLAGTHCYCPLGALLLCTGALPPESNEGDIRDTAEMTWPDNFRFGFLYGFDRPNGTLAPERTDPDYAAGWWAGDKARQDLADAGLLYSTSDAALQTPALRAGDI